MDKLIEQLSNISSNTIGWQLYLYSKVKRASGTLYVAYSWSASDKKLIPSLINSIIECSKDSLIKEDYTLQNYTPNNNKNTIDKIPIDSLLIKKNYESLLEALSSAKPYTQDVGKLKGYILLGKDTEDEQSYPLLVVGIGNPVKNYKHAFFNHSVMKETESDIITIKPFWDILIHKEICYMSGTNAHAFFDLQSYHAGNMQEAHQQFQDSGLVIKIPPHYPKSGKSIFTDILNIHNNMQASIQYWIKYAIANPADELAGKLKLVDGKIDASEMESYLSLVELLSCRHIIEGSLKGNVRPIDVTFSPQ